MNALSPTLEVAIRACLVIVACSVLTVPSVSGQERRAGAGKRGVVKSETNEGVVHIGGGKWLPPDQARARGFFEYHRRWFPENMRATLKKWEKQDRKHAAWRCARRITTKHYRIVTNVPRFIVETELKPFLDELYRTYTSVFREKFGLRGKGANKRFIHIHWGYEDYAVENGENGQPVSRRFPGQITKNRVLIVYYDETEPEVFYRAAFHEGAHQFVRALLPGARFPLWIDEALATYFEGCSYSRAAKTVRVDFIPPARLANAQRVLRGRGRDRREWALDDVIGVSDAAFTIEHYAPAWSLMYFMTHGDGGARKRQLTKFLKAANGSGVKRSAEELFFRAVRTERSALESQWREFVLGLKCGRKEEWPVVTAVKGTGGRLDLKQGDIVRSFNYQRLTSGRRFEELWRARRPDRSSKLVIVRREKEPGPMEYRARLIEVEVPPDCSAKVQCRSGLPRNSNLAD